MIEKPDNAIYNLREHQQQLDMDGIMVGVSRQALEETLDYVTSLERQLAEHRTVTDQEVGDE